MSEFDAPTTAVADLTGDYTIDPSHTRLGFVARHAMVTKVRGSFEEFEGTAHIDTATPANSKIDLTIKAASVTTGSPDRDGHLKTGDFFEVEANPDLTFTSTDVTRDGATWSVTGDLTIKGTSKPVTIDFEETGSAKDPFGNTRVGFEGEVTIDRTEWNLSFNAALETGGVLVSEKVKLEFDISAIAQESPAAPRRVVVAEDESLIRLDIVEILRDNGFDVVGEAGDGETAVQLATELRPDLVVMDVKMPQLDGISAAEKLSKNHIAPVVLLTAFSQKELVERASEAGALAYVVKPFTPNDLLPAIEIALSRYQQIVTLEAEVADMVERFETRKLVDRAKGLLNEKMGLSEPEAFRWIQKASMDRRLTMHDVAQAIIEQLAPKKA
jgi:response regulator NasT